MQVIQWDRENNKMITASDPRGKDKKDTDVY